MRHASRPGMGATPADALICGGRTTPPDVVTRFQGGLGRVVFDAPAVN